MSSMPAIVVAALRKRLKTEHRTEPKLDRSMVLSPPPRFAPEPSWSADDMRTLKSMARKEPLAKIAQSERRRHRSDPAVAESIGTLAARSFLKKPPNERVGSF
jgi:hypothetical protein